MLPLLAIGAGLLMAGKVASDMSEAKKISQKAQEFADIGNRYLEEVKKIQGEIEKLIKNSAKNVQKAKQKGLECLIKNFLYFKDIDIKNDKFNLLKIQIQNDIEQYNLSISIDEVINFNSNISKLTEKLGMNISEFKINQKQLVDDVGVETSAALIAHGTLAAGIGGVSALIGAEFVMATGIGALVLAPFVLSVSSDKVKEAEEAYLKAEEFQEQALIEKEKWEGYETYINMFRSISFFYKSFIKKIIEVSDFWCEKYLIELKKIMDTDKIIQINPEIIAKNIITLAYLNKFIQYEYATKEDIDIQKIRMGLNPFSDDWDKIGELDLLIEWVKNKGEEEQIKFIELETEIEKIKG